MSLKEQLHKSHQVIPDYPSKQWFNCSIIRKVKTFFKIESILHGQLGSGLSNCSGIFNIFLVH